MEKFKKKCKIFGSTNTPDKHIITLISYWSFNGVEFANTPKSISEKYNLTSLSLYDLVFSFSDVKVYDHCENCGMEMMTEVKCQMEFLEAYDNKGICVNCQE